MKTRTKPKAPPDPTGRTEELEQKLRAETGRGPEDYALKDWVSMREMARLRLLYPGYHVAFRDHWDGQHPGRRLLLREVLCASREMREVQDHLMALPEGLAGVFMWYEEEPRRRSKKR